MIKNKNLLNSPTLPAPAKDKDSTNYQSSSESQYHQNIFGEITNKIKLGLSFPKLMANDGKLLNLFISADDQRYIKISWKRHLPRIQGHTNHDIKPDKPLFVTSGIQHCQLHYPSEYSEEILKLCSETYSILQNQGFEFYCDEHLQDMISEAGVKFLKTFEKLGKFPVQKKNNLSKSFENRAEKKSEALDLALEARQELMEFQISYEDQRFQCKQMLDEKQKIISDYKMKLETIKRNVSENIGKIIEKSEEKITLGIQSSKQRQGNMLNTLIATEEKLKSLQEFNRCKEKALHVIRKNAEAELKSLINKYDEDMNRKQCELEELMAQYEKEKIMFIELKKNFGEQNEIYVKLMAEKSEYEQALWDQRLLEVRQKFAARKIQRCVRNYLAKLKTRGKKYGSRKKGKKGAKK